MAHNLQDINDDCLLEIFANLTVCELADVASICSRIKAVARDSFRSRHKSNCLEIYVEPGNQNKGQYVRRRQQTAAILRNFGDMLTNLKVIFWYSEAGRLHNTFIFDMMVRYCTGPLNRMCLINCGKYLQPDKVNDATSLFRNVKELILDNSFAVESRFLCDAAELTRLTLRMMSFKRVNAFLSNDYPKLQSLAVNKRYTDSRAVKKRDISPFWKRHPHLLELELSGSGVYDMSSIGECVMLRKLYIWDYYYCEGRDLSPMAQLANLTSLTLQLTTDSRRHSSIAALLQA